ncbi:uncharacterized protein LOC131316984 [Rhododendron vialii]|uniref:uncharacterized protein LOC131316984 n=1 Tax=Rhododendron vialii TaxID=182163 RepID=UPI00265FFAD2|nr:uncharacterized protein LOC131316984 [Rhododendron vialii]
MAAPTYSGESDMATEDFFLNLSPLPSPRWSPPQPFLPSSNSMVMQYQGSNQSTDDPPQNQEHDDIVDLAPYLAGDSTLLQQQLRKNWSEASDWRPRGGGIMTMNNQGFEESNMGFYIPPSSPTYFPLSRPMPSVFLVSSEQGNISLALSYQHILEDKSGALHVINWEDGENIFALHVINLVSYLRNKFGDFDQITRASGVAPKVMESLVHNILEQENYDEREVTLRRINWLEQPDKDIVDQPVFEVVGVVQQLIQNRGGELDVILGGGVLTINGLERRDSQGLPTTPETVLNCQAKFSTRVWLGHGGQWVAEIRYTFNRFNIGSFTTVEDAISAYELVTRLSGWMDLTGIPGLSENTNRSKLQLQLPPIAQEEKPEVDFGNEAVGTGSERTGECVMVDQARLNSGCSRKRKTKEKNRGGERRNKKTNVVRITIPLEDITQTKGMHLKDAANHLGVTIAELMSSCQEYGIQIWSPRNEHKLIMQTLPDETPAVVDQEVIPQLTSHNVPSDQAFMATVDTNSVVEKEVPQTQFLPTAQQENLDAGFGNDGAEAIGMGGEETGEVVIEEAQLNFGCLKKQEKMKVNTPGGERGNNKTTGVRIAILKEDILRTKGMRLKDVANHLGGGRSALEHNLISCPNETPAVVDQEGIPQLNSNTLPFDQALVATVDTNTSVVVKDIPQPQFSLTDRQDNPDDFGKDEVEVVGMVGEGTRDDKIEEGQLNSECLGKGKRKEETSGGDKRNKKTNGVKIAISLDDILQAEGMLLEDAAKKFKVSRSTLKRVCRKYGILSWPPSKGNEHINQSHTKESPAVVDQEGVQQLNCDILPSHQALAVIVDTNSVVSVVDQEGVQQSNCEILPSDRALAANVDTNSVVLKARWVDDIIVKIRLPKPWKLAELEQQVKKRLKIDAGTYYIRYKDEENELITIFCDEDLEEYISNPRPLNTCSIEVFLVPK